MGYMVLEKGNLFFVVDVYIWGEYSLFLSFLKFYRYIVENVILVV